MTKGRDSSQVIRAGEATCPWDLSRMTQLISQAGSLGFMPTRGMEGGCFHSALGLAADGCLE